MPHARTTHPMTQSARAISNHLQRAGRWLGVVGAVLLVPGCNLAGVPFAGFENHGVKARYELPRASTAVVVEATSRRAEDERFAQQIAARVIVQLEDNLAISADPPAPPSSPTAPPSASPAFRVVNAAALASLKQKQGDAYYQMPIDRLGRELGADTVVYVKVRKAELNDQGPVLQPQAQLSVRVIDANTGARLWPESAAGMDGDVTGWPVEVGSVHQTTSAGEISGSTQDRAWRTLADDAGKEVSRLFYDWQRPRVGSKAQAEKDRLDRIKRTNEAALP